MMYCVIIVVLLNMVCATRIAAPSHPFCEIAVEFLGFVPPTLSTFAVFSISGCDIPRWFKAHGVAVIWGEGKH